jgi:hypothetical protein
MTIDERLEALAQHVEVMQSMQLETEKSVQQLAATQQETQAQLKRLTREVRLFRSFVLSMGANLEARVLYLESQTDEGADEGKKPS